VLAAAAVLSCQDSQAEEAEELEGEEEAKLSELPLAGIWLAGVPGLFCCLADLRLRFAQERQLRQPSGQLPPLLIGARRTPCVFWFLRLGFPYAAYLLASVSLAFVSGLLGFACSALFGFVGFAGFAASCGLYSLLFFGCSVLWLFFCSLVVLWLFFWLFFECYVVVLWLFFGCSCFCSLVVLWLFFGCGLVDL
jgi:hypothetical protein